MTPRTVKTESIWRRVLSWLFLDPAAVGGKCGYCRTNYLPRGETRCQECDDSFRAW